MKQYISLLFCLLSISFCQAQGKQYAIKGNISGECNGMKVKLLKTTYPEEIINETVIRDNAFEMKGEVPTPGMYRWIIDRTPQGEESEQEQWLSDVFYLENSAITFTGDMATLPSFYWDPEGEIKQPMVIRGSATEDLFQEYNKSMKELRDEQGQRSDEYLKKYHQPAINGVFNTAEGIRLARQISLLSDKINKKKLEFIRRHSASIVAYDRAASFLHSGTQLTIAQIDELVAILEKSHGESPLMAEFKAKADKARLTAIGVRYPDIELVTPEGKTVKLSQYVPEGKYVLLEFWASWCGPCRGEIPHLKHLYKEYQEKGFEIVSISIDGKDDEWQKALKEENMSWTQLDDPKGFQGPAQQVYNLDGVPYCILLDKDGRVYKAGMRGAFLDVELEELFSR